MIKKILHTFSILCLLTTNVFAQAGSNDSTFNTFDDGAFGTGSLFDNIVFAGCLQADGKIVAGGTFSSYNGTARTRIARLNTNGSLDTTFNPGSGFDNSVYFLTTQTDGKIIAVGQFTSFNGTARNKIARLNTDGSLDTTFNPGTGFNAWANEVDIQADGKIIVGGVFTNFNGSTTNRIARLNTDGSLDNTFNTGAGFSGGIFTVDIQTDGKIILGGGFTNFNGTTRNCIARLNADGSLDATFNPGSGFDLTAFYTKIQSDGKVIVGGTFSSFNGTARNRIARLNANGSLDTTFNPGTGFDNVVDHIDIQADGKIMVGGNFTNFNGISRNRLTRLNADGSLDNTFNIGTGFNSMVYPVDIQTDGKIMVSGTFTMYNDTTKNRIARLNTDGTIDPFFNQGSGFLGSVGCTSIQSDGKIIVGGQFTSFNGTARNYITRLIADGSLDTTFDPGTGFNSAVRSTSIQADGKIIVGGNFTSFNGTARNYIARLNADGSLDTTFDPGTSFNSSVSSINIQADGKIIVGGIFTSFNGTARNRIARLNADGSLDATFDPGTGFNNVIFCTNIQADGRVIAGGFFASFNGTARNAIARLNTDGSLDTTFNPGTGFNGGLRSINIQADGRVIAGGGYSNFNGTARNMIARLNADGSLDSTFDPGTGFTSGINSTTIQADGKIIVGGGFTSFNGTATNRIALLNTDGSIDANFDPGTGFNSSVFSTSIQADGRIIVGGTFMQFDSIPRNRIARLLSCSPPTADAPISVSACDSYTLPALAVGNYYTEVNAGGTMLNAGDTISSTQTLYVYAADGSCTDENSFDVTIIPAPISPSAVTPISVCPGADVILTATGSGSGDILIFNSMPTLIGTIPMPSGTATFNAGFLPNGTYTFGILESNGSCQSLPTEITVNVFDVTAPVPTVATLADITANCSVISLTEPTATDNCSAVVTVTNNAVLPITAQGTTVVTWTYDDGSGNTTTQNQTVTITGIDVSTTLGPSGVEITANNGNGDNYQWIDCSTGDTIANATNQTYIASTNGSYAVIINEDGCIDTSACAMIISAGLDDLAMAFTIYPNPTLGGSFTIKVDVEIDQIELMDALGRLVSVLEVTSDRLVDVSSVDMGNYFVKITTMDGRQLLAPIVVAK